MANKKAQRQKKHLALTVSLVGEMIEINRMVLLVLVFTAIATLEKALAVTNINDSNFHSAIETCLGTNPVDGLCSSSEYGSMPDWDMGQVSDLEEAFKGYDTFNADISKWDTSSVTNMRFMFEDAHVFNQPIGNWDVSQVRVMGQVFRRANAFNQPIGNWNTSQAYMMEMMFDEANAFNQDISAWDVSGAVSYTHLTQPTKRIV